MGKETAGSFRIRTLTALVALPVLMYFVWRPPFPGAFAVVIGVFAGIGLFEYYAIVRARQISPETIGGILSGTMVALSGLFDEPRVVNLMLYGGCLLVSALHIVRGQHSVAGLASSVFGVFYVGWFAAHVVLLHCTPGLGAGLVTMLIVTIALSDTGAYLVGSLIGRHKLAPTVSPNKTWEGSFGGFAAAVVGMGAVYALRDRYGWTAVPDWPLWRYLYAGAILSVAGQVGDLAESCLKRDAGMKDSGVTFPGHGGVLDRCDGLLFAAPVLYYIVKPLFVH